jgi:hypothetical protein
MVIALRIGVKMDNLGGCMYARVRAARTGHADGTIRHPAKRMLDHRLHAQAVTLGLPAVETTAIIFYP